MKTLIRAALVLAAVIAILLAGASPVSAGHPKPDPQPSHGTDCDNGNPWGGNHDHCASPTPEVTPSAPASADPSAIPTNSPSSEPTASLPVEPSAEPSAAPSTTPSPEPSANSPASPSPDPTAGSTTSPVPSASTPTPSSVSATMPPTDTSSQPSSSMPDDHFEFALAYAGVALLFIAALSSRRKDRR